MVEVMLLNFEITSSSSSWKPSPARPLTAAWPSPIPEMRRNPDEVTRNEEANVETQCWKAPPLPSSAASLPSEPWPPPRLPRLLAAPGPQPPAWCSIIILFLLLEQIPLYFCLQGGAVGVVLSHDHSLFLMKKRVLAFQSSSWSNGQNFHNKLFFLSCANFHIHSSLDSIYLIRKLRSKINYLCSSKPESCRPWGTSGFQRPF